MEYTKECLGATDVQLGNVTPDNTSALILLQNSSSVPLGNIRAGVHEWVEDIGAILLDLIGTYYGTRPVAGESGISEQFDFSVFRSLWFKVRADIGPMKADKLLSISNTYLSKLQDLEKWAYEKNVSADEFNAKLYQWETEYEQSVEKMQRDYDLQMQKIYASAAQAMIKNGINLTGEQLESIGWTEPQYMAYRYYNG